MELLNRYLHAVGARLPEAYREDIVAELRGELLARIEEREGELRRHLTEPELVALLKACGHPLVVAASYVHGEHVISPALLPFYRFAVQALIGVDVLVHLIYVTGALIFRESAGHVLATAANSLWIVTMYLLGVVTFSALVLDRLGAARWLAKAWSPRYLPRSERRSPARIVLVLDTVALIVLAGWVTGVIPIWRWIAWPVGSQVHPTAPWSVAGTVLLLIAAAQLATHLLERWRSRLALPCLLAKLVQNVAVLALAGALISAQPWIRVSGLDPTVGQAFAHALGTTMNIAIGVLVGSATIALLVNTLRLTRRLRRLSIRGPAAA